MIGIINKKTKQTYYIYKINKQLSMFQRAKKEIGIWSLRFWVLLRLIFGFTFKALIFWALLRLNPNQIKTLITERRWSHYLDQI